MRSKVYDYGIKNSMQEYYSLEISFGKTKMMTNLLPSERRNVPQSETEIEIAEKYTYLLEI